MRHHAKRAGEEGKRAARDAGRERGAQKNAGQLIVQFTAASSNLNAKKGEKKKARSEW